MQSTINGGRRRGRQKKGWEDNIREWTGLELRNTLQKAEDREEWKAVVGRSSAVARQIPNLRDRAQSKVTRLKRKDKGTHNSVDWRKATYTL
ncbi:UDP-glucuronosyltransferase 2a1-like [Plakobranchus ocellatus]|uniref:UDP-glucuronosyltransferase 2a1-like n=1 Tax=Plakobranchus ocellatus TaxID=259542 RepID=A0AAV3Y789_9GAST|nr:UDP-glucuronosyltransferase 2a1-like [Plakobranchus ocellatus]